MVNSIWTAPVPNDVQGLVGCAITNPIRAYTPWQIVTEVSTHQTSDRWLLRLQRNPTQRTLLQLRRQRLLGRLKRKIRGE